MKKGTIIAVFILITNVVFAQSGTAYIESILENINKIKSASYQFEKKDITGGNSYQGDFQMYLNPVDTLTGARFLFNIVVEETDYTSCYDGKYSVRLNRGDKSAQVDTMTAKPWMTPTAPFLIQMKTLFAYVIENEEKVEISYKEYQDSTKIDFRFDGRVIEFFRLTPYEQIKPDKSSLYEVWIDTKTNFPFKYIRKMPHQWSSTICSNLVINNKEELFFDALEQIPDDYTVTGRK